MGMILVVTTLRDENIARVLADPPLIWSVLAPDDPERVTRARASSRGLFARLFGRSKAPIEHVPLEFADGEVQETDLDKAWHGIHYLLTGSNWKGELPLGFLLCGGETVGKIDPGYGPARVLTSVQVRAVARALEPVDEAYLRARFNPVEMMKLGIYPAIWDRDPADDDTFDYCAHFFASLKTFVTDAAQRGVGIVVSLS